MHNTKVLKVKVLLGLCRNTGGIEVPMTILEDYDDAVKARKA